MASKLSSGASTSENIANESRRRVRRRRSSNENDGVGEELIVYSSKNKERTVPNTKRLSLPRTPARQYSVPWGSEWPELIDYYLLHEPDFTGLGMYGLSRYPAEYAMMAFQSPAAHTANILLAESLRVSNRAPESRLIWLKGHVFRMTNKLLQDPKAALETTAIATITSLAIHDLICGNGQATRFHLAGVKRIADLRGGIETLNSSMKIKEILLFTDALHAHCTGTEHYFPGNKLDTLTTYSVTNPLRKALIPHHSGLSPWRLRHQMITTLAAPMQGTLFCFRSLYQLSEALIQQRSAGTMVLLQLWLSAKQTEDYLLHLSGAMSRVAMPTSFFASEDREHYFEASILANRCGLVLASWLIEVIDRCMLEAAHVPPSRNSRDMRDHNVMALGMIDLKRIEERAPEVALWSLWVGTPFVGELPIRSAAVSKMVNLIKKIHLEQTWDAMVMFLETVYYCPGLQETVCKELWEEIVPQLRAGDTTSW